MFVCSASRIYNCLYFNGKGKCPIEINFEDTLFFLQNKLEDIEVTLPTEEFKTIERDLLHSKVDQLLEEIQTIKLGQEITYDDILLELKSLKENSHLSKKDYYQLALGKFTDMTTSGIVGETVSKPIAEQLKKIVTELLS